MATQLQNLINKHGANRLKDMIDEQVLFTSNWEKLKDILKTPESATQWFTNWADDRNLKLTNIYDQTAERQEGKYAKSCLCVDGWRSDKPYVYLWLNKDDNPHFELGNEYMDLWSAFGYDDLITKLDKIVKLRENT